MTVSDELCFVTLPFCYRVAVVALPFSASLGVIVHDRVADRIWGGGGGGGGREM